MADLAALIVWLNQAVDDLPGDQATITLNINGSDVDANVKTVSKETDPRGLLVQVERKATIHLRIGRRDKVQP